ncbi:type I secretion system permease/ATPase [Pseudomaricurvus alcaniphilus]|uniref:type I secretion system permease/ATPase n=1 Tax=Pseudomaricurvus alcaniphilus TaxID=1166482 RepID=UPI0014092BB6|nr:type I secretion system permease/ATPase [Pseudomaricurvus alcaniphilus]NHN37431.1 type I secretion system permease/ATPase [Pseudomaricurvus alcaniphilus]
MDARKTQPQDVDTAARSLFLLAQYHQVATDEAGVLHQFAQPGQPMNDGDLLRAAAALDFKARKHQSDFAGLKNKLLPAIGKTKAGDYFVIARVTVAQAGINTGAAEAEARALVFFPAESSPREIPQSELQADWSGELFLFTRRGAAGTGPGQFDISWFIPALLKYRKLFADVLLASLFLQLFALLTPLFFQVVMDKVLVHRGLTTLDVLACGFFVVLVFEALLGAVRNYVFSHTTNRVDVELGAKLFQHLLRLPMAYFEARQVGQSAARVRELETIRNFITGSALTLCIDLLFTFLFFVVMWYYSPTLTLVVLGSVPFFIVLSLLITPVLRRRLDEKFNFGARNQAFLVEAVNGIETVKASAVEPQMQRHWEEQLAGYVNASFRAQHVGNLSGQVAGLISKVTTLLIIYLGAYAVMDGKMTVGELVAFNMLAGRVSGPVLKLVQLWQEFQQARISIARLGDILNTPAEPGFNPGRSSLPRLHGRIQLQHVKFRYGADSPLVLDDVSLDIRAGEVLGIVGRSGSGKSTLTKLVQRFYLPEAGSILVDGANLGVIDTQWLRQNVGVVLQDNFLFNRSIRANIALVNPGLSMQRVVAAAKLAGAHDFILQLPEGYDTTVGEQGCNLSGGQRQRLAIARALINNPRILILDEATSALDYESERIIQENMAAICQNRTVLIIAHRLSTVRQCDRIIVMENGRIIEQGRHDDLLEANGYYTQLHSYQNHTPRIRQV